MKRLSRLTAILSLLQSKQFTQLKEIINKFEISERTAYRDIKSLQDSGAPIAYEQDRGYFILDRHFLPPLSFSIEEAKAFIFVELLAKKYTDPETYHYYANGLEKIKNKLKHFQLEEVEALESSTSVYIDPNYAPKYLQTAEKACRQKNVLRIKYEDNNGNQTDRMIEPIGITFYSQSWHIIAFCRLRKDYRDFVISRITHLQVTAEKFTNNHWTLQEYISNL